MDQAEADEEKTAESRGDDLGQTKTQLAGEVPSEERAGNRSETEQGNNKTGIGYAPVQLFGDVDVHKWYGHGAAPIDEDDEAEEPGLAIETMESVAIGFDK